MYHNDDFRVRRKVQFICKQRSGDYPGATKDSGLRNSARFCVEALQNCGVPSELVVVQDNNSIDREVTRYRPTDVIIEALWVVPEKFEVLRRLHPNVRWIIRIHSEIAFLANEGSAIDWLVRYLNYPNVCISGNTVRLVEDLRSLVREAQPNIGFNEIYDRVVYLPNCYRIEESNEKALNYPDDVIRVGCFGAIRPMKNQLAQAMAAVRFAEEMNYCLEFHINSERVEQRGEQILANLRALFKSTRHRLIEHTWMPHAQFLRVARQMDIGLQVSLSETFNIVTADLVSQMVPMVVSPEVHWMPWMTKVNPTSIDAIAGSMCFVWKLRKWVTWLSYRNLEAHSAASARIWCHFFHK